MKVRTVLEANDYLLHIHTPLGRSLDLSTRRLLRLTISTTLSDSAHPWKFGVFQRIKGGYVATYRRRGH